MHDKRPRQHQPQTQQKQAARCTGTLEAMSSAAAVVVVICAGSWRGSIEVASDAVTVGSLKRQLCSISGLAAVKLIVAGRSLKDDTKTISDCGIRTGTHILVLKVASADQQRELADAAMYQERVERLKTAVGNMASRNSSLSHRSLTLENQDGAPLSISSDDEQLLMTGMWLHENAKRYMKQGQWSRALQDLELGDESFQLCQCNILESSDNAGLLLLDLVWCIFKLQDEGRLASAQQRLRRARESLTRAHGATLERLRCLHGGFKPELATYVRLEALEGLSLWYCGDSSAAKTSFLSAEAKWRQLAVSDESLAALAHMGFSSTEGRRALRFCSNDVAAAAELILRCRREEEERIAKLKVCEAAVRQGKVLGRTDGRGEAIDVVAAQNLSDMGFDIYVAMEAVRQADNNGEAALNALTDPVRHAALTFSAAAAIAAAAARKASRKELRAAGYERYYVRKAVDNCPPGQLTQARDVLDSWANAMRLQEQAGPGQELAVDRAAAEGLGASATSASEAAAVMCSETATVGPCELFPLPLPPPPPETLPDNEAAAAEQEVAAVLGNDSLSGYDIDVDEEGAIIRDFLDRIDQQSLVQSSTV